jgi:hypothetical protein
MGAVVHNIYVYGAGDSRRLTLSLLRYIHTNLKLLTEMGVQIRVHKISEHVLQTPRVVEAMEARGITSFPALVTPSGVFLGNRGITTFYERNIQKFNAWTNRRAATVGRRQRQTDPEEDDLTNYYNSEMRPTCSDGPTESGAEDLLGGEDSTHMMKYYDSMLQLRQQRGQTFLEETEPRHRPNNVADETEFRRASSGSSGETSSGFSGGAPMSGASGDEESAQEDQMFQSYWENQESTPGI